MDSAHVQWPVVLAKRFTDEKQILRAFARSSSHRFVAEGVGGEVRLLATRIDRLSIGGSGIVQPVAIRFRTAGYQEEKTA